LREALLGEIARVQELLNLEEDDRKITEHDHLKAIEDLNRRLI